jgi:hypothetical protein
VTWDQARPRDRARVRVGWRPGYERKVLVLGDPGGVGEALALRLTQLGGEADTVTGAQHAELAATLDEPEWTAIAVVTHDDALALRLTLLGAPLRPELPLWVTLFDRTIAHQLRQIVPSVNIVATAEVAARKLARHCTALFGLRRAMARGHVLLVGFGQIGFRLAQELQRQQIPVIALDSDAEAPCVRLARRAGVPVAIGRGDD